MKKVSSKGLLQDLNLVMELAYKVCCWGKSKSSEKPEETTKEGECNSNEHCECYKTKKENYQCNKLQKEINSSDITTCRNFD